ncbi:MAG TPA: hypothetical protein VFV86_13330 [Nitrososphaeraceae archaeon]|nr:hypothetical protein [Nitrososphaeraceae archaeon]
MNYLQNKLYCSNIYLIILISFIILNLVNIYGQTNNDKLFINYVQIFDNEKDVEAKDALIEENVTAKDALIEEK